MRATKVEQGFFLLIAAILVLFARGLLEAFDLSKAIVTWALGIYAMWGIAMSPHFRKSPKNLIKEQWPLVALLLAATLATVTSADVRRSIFGQDHRFTGLITLISCLAIAGFSASMSTAVVISGIRRWIALATFIISGYAILQFSNGDPFQWSITSFGGVPFSTLGNPNVLAACVAILMPVVYSGVNLRSRIGNRLYFAFCFALLVAVGSMADSFQVIFGPLSALVFVILSSRAESGRASVTYALLWDVVTISLSGVMVLSSLRTTLGAVTITLIVLLLALRVMGSGRWFRKPLFEVRYWQLAFTGLGLIAALFPFLRDQIENAGYERSAFYRAVFSAFLDKPIIGHGLENFGRVFPQHRPSWHAETLESSLTNSPHSIILGTLSTGGIVLFVAMVCFFVVALYRSWLRWKSSDDMEGNAALLSGILVVMAIFLVSVESVPLFVIGFGLVGSGLRREGRSRERAERRSRYERHFRRPSRVGALLAVVGSAVTFAGAYPVVVAEVKLQDGMDALYLDGRPDLAEPILNRVVDLRPDEPRYRLQLANSLLSQQKFDQAVDELVEAVRASNFNTIVVMDVRRILLELGRNDLVSEITNQAKARDKFAPSL